MNFKFSKKIVLIFVVIIILGAVGYGFISKKNSSQQQPTSMGMQSKNVKVKVRDIEDIIYASGKLRAKESETILAKTSGVMSQIKVKAGQEVKKGEVIASLAVEDLLKQVSQKELAFTIDKNNFYQAKRTAEKNLEEAKINLEEKEALYAVDAISKSDLKQAKEAYSEAETEIEINVSDTVPTNLETKYLQYKQSELELNNLYSDLEAADIKSPMDGVITNIYINQSDFVNSKQKLFEVALLNELEIVTTVGEYEVNKIKQGMVTEITGDAFTTDYSGQVSNISASAISSGSETVVEVIVDIEDETSELKQNFTANANIIVASAKEVLSVPIDAVGETENGDNLILIKAGEIYKGVKVATGVENDLYIEISSDEIKEGDIVAAVYNDKLLGAPSGR